MRPPASTLRLASFASGRTGTSGPNNSNGGANTPIPSIFGRKELPHTMRTHIVAFLGEFVGTFMFLFFAFAGTQVANTPPPSDTPGAVAPPNAANLIFIALAFGTSLMANVWAFYRVTGGLFNPSVTLALFLVGGIPALRSVLFLAAQLLGGIAAAGVVSALFPGPMAVNTTLGGGASVAQGLFIEMFLTAELVFVIIMVAAEKHKSTFLAPVAIGLAFFLAELVGVYFTGGSLNFARSLGPAVVDHTFPGYFWIYFVGPLLGSLLASGFYSLLNYLRWKDCNPGQDFNDVEKLQSESQKHVNAGGDDTKNGVRETNGGVVEQDEHADH
ncbi:aquaporin-like protein [Cercophora scortea]|uniref:Aquaporin-like protein n=1 Tax=Cercophora scortea TaxID=314031 RepID=A0AAE0J7I2_9PEZI|nr:aquaporin-like protein [Cercophora scortea]